MKRNGLPKAVHGMPLRYLMVSGALLTCSMAAWSMDLLQAYEAAKTNDATILESRATAQGGRERLPQARAQLLPYLAFGASRNRNNLSQTAPNILGQVQTTSSIYPSSNNTLTLRQSLFRPQQTAQYRQAKAQVDDAEATLEQDEQNLAVRVSGAYFEAMLTREQLDLVLSQRAAYTTQLDAARKSLAGGSGTRTDVDDAQARLDMNAAVEIEARKNIDYTMRQLQVLVNQPIDQLSMLDLSKFEPLDPQPNRVEDWYERASQNSPQLASLKAQVEASRQEVDKARSGHYPTLDAVAQWSKSDSENILNINSDYTNKSIGLQLNVPIYAGGYVNSTVRQALAGQEKAEQALEAGRRDLEMRVFKEFRGVVENVPKISALEQALRSADQSVLSSKKSFQGGNRTIVDVMDAEQRRVLVLRDLAQARYLYLVSKVRLLALVGSADVEAIASINRVLQN